jgi:nitric oxide reductase NorD protein
VNAGPVLHVVSDPPQSATHRLHALMRQRETLRPVFLTTWDTLSRNFDSEELEAWASSVLTLANVNAGPSCLMAYWDVSTGAPETTTIASLTNAALASADICRNAGAKAATSVLRALPIVRETLGQTSLPRWWQVISSMAQRAPESVEILCSNLQQILRPGSIEAFEDFVATGLKASSGD